MRAASEYNGLPTSHGYKEEACKPSKALAAFHPAMWARCRPNDVDVLASTNETVSGPAP